MSLIEQTKEWLKLHEEAGRELEVLACKLRLKTLERCEAKKHKPDFVDNIGHKADANVITYAHMSRRSPNHEPYIDDVLLNVVILQAVKDFQESRK